MFKNTDDFSDLDNFSPEFWKKFYEINDPFFNENDQESIVHDQIIINNEKMKFIREISI